MSSRYAASEYDSAESRPDKPLVVKCNYEGVNKRITFSSSRTCTFDLLKHRVEESFSLSPTSYGITYTDDDGEITVITTEGDLTEAIRYFYPGTSDDPPLSSAASILSGRSFGRSRITLRVKITIDYDGPSLSDTSSLASTEEYQGRHDDRLSMSLSSSSASFSGEVEEDARTVSSKDTGSRSRSRYNFFRARGTRTVVPGACKKPRSSSRQDEWEEETVSSIPKTMSLSGSSLPAIEDDEETGVFERLKVQEAIESEDPQGLGSGTPAMQNERYTAWLQEQNARTQLVRPRAPARVDTPDDLSVAESMSIPADDAGSILSGELALEKGNGGRFYYTYTSGSSVSAPASVDSGFDDSSSGLDDGDSAAVPDARPASSDGSWLEGSARPSSSSGPRHHSPSHRSHSEPLLPHEEILPDIPRELLPFITAAVPPPADPTDCSNCGARLETLRYVCATCGEKEPASRVTVNGFMFHGKGKGKDQDPFASTATFTYPPSMPRTELSSASVSSWTLVADNPFDDSKAVNFKPQKPLPALPSSPSSSPSSLTIPGITLHSHSGGSSSTLSSQGPGFELCFNCIESVGVVHALEASIGPESSPLPLDLPPSPEETQRALSEWRRTASRKGQLRHAYIEKVWGPRGWDNVEHDDHTTVKCSTCPSTIVGKRYKCATCENFNLCKACYSQVHEIHPSHPFLVILEKPMRTRSEPVIEHPTLTPDDSGELSMTHTGVKCAHCLLEIVGARFHCAICPSIDICSNCESAGLPGNLDSSDDGHNSSHIMIKIPYPLPMQELENASRRAQQLWGKDAATVDEEGKKSRRGSLGSAYARTVIGPSASALDLDLHHGVANSHNTRCDVCRKMILGVRYQCAMCPSKPQPFSLCSDCEARSYAVHDQMHVFFKLSRPVDNALEVDGPLLPILYRVPAGPPGGTYIREQPKEYLAGLLHSAAVCDRCMQRITGEWFRCVYCATDLCDNCEAVDTHNYKHFFMVFKSTVDMQKFRRFAQLDNAEAHPPRAVVPFAVYTS
ncbi:hypothetical protein PHLGIDRAFT_129451 [Phlebiopsis gigantea 11061_1 CR5-6]|uniref:ZZ-type domain-containing protein n=1 Tax=Phlebiopsis gigantea (strain 11061_1 CR5-6) TaxID=745531 RepID=A0A0C3NI30_PHLG1|nr:hypothetical protein PHLGIDRAFT_129451 [Phlebiopsis gigantea 11061_1 CR5-6]